MARQLLVGQGSLNFEVSKSLSRDTPIGRIPLEDWSTRPRHLYLPHTTTPKTDINQERITVLTFVGPCIVIYFYSKTNQMHNISNLFYFGTTLYMFRRVSSPIIRSLRLYIYLMLYVQP